MKFNWVNLLATLLIVGGVGLLIDRHWTKPQHRDAPTVEEAKADIERQIQTKLGRPLSEAETDMIEVTKTGEQINITLHQPLYGRLAQAIRAARAATLPSGQNSPGINGTELMAPSSGGIGSAPSESATSAPTSGLR